MRFSPYIRPRLQFTEDQLRADLRKQLKLVSIFFW